MAKTLKIAALLLLLSPALAIGDVRYVIKGVSEEQEANILGHIDFLQLGPQASFRPRDRDKVVSEAIADARAALRPFGYYAPEITAQVIPGDGRSAAIELTIDVGEPVRIANVEVRVDGPGSGDRAFRSWRRNWPLTEGMVLNQAVWESSKQDAIDAANDRGYLAAEFVDQRIEIDLEQNTTDLILVLETGPRYVMGDIDFGTHELRPGIVEYIPRFEKGDFYTSLLVSRLRTDLWTTGFFDDVVVIETQRPDLDPPAVDFELRLATETRNHYSGAVGWGDGTGIRLSANYSRHPASAYGDRLDLGVGYQELDDQFRLRGRWQRPVRNRARQRWDAELTLQFENLDLEIRFEEEDENTFKVAGGDLDEQHFRFGRTWLSNLRGGEAQQFVTPFAQYLRTDRTFNQFDDEITPDPQTDDPNFEHWLRGEDNTISLGLDYEVIDVQGRGFYTYGRRDRAWAFHSNDAFGSSVEFSQLYASTRRSYLRGNNTKFHLRAEIGYTDAEVDSFVVRTPSGPVELLQTRLPNYYRFKAGGAMSVRGYGFEQLSNNDVGSNNIITASAEAEYRFRESWSAAAFFDIGNAFNDWDDPDLKRGVGVGLRWYSIAGEIRVDVAQALDFTDKPWSWHITIGTPLL